jgi:uncharacterized delta-60 repeat protein
MHGARFSAATLGAAIALFVFSTSSAAAAPGDLDLTYGYGGVASAPTSFGYEALGFTARPDGLSALVGALTSGDTRIVRVSPGGFLDSSFSTDGIKDFDWDGQVTSIGLHASGAIAYAGRYGSGLYGGVTEPDGHDAIGATNSDVGSNCGFLALSIGIDQNVTAVGHCESSSSLALIGRYPTFPNIPVSGFGSGGYSTGGKGTFLAVTTLPDGKALAAGVSEGASSDDFYVVRYKSNGDYDFSFGAGNGKAVVPVGGLGTASAQAIAVAPDGKLVVAGWANVPGGATNAAVVRLNPGGTLDQSFGNGGIVLPLLGSGDSTFLGVAVQSNGKVVAVGRAPDSQPVVMRLTSDGQPDESFAPAGRRIGLPGVSSGTAYGVSITSEGKILVGENLRIGVQKYMSVVRLLGGEGPASGGAAPKPTAKFKSPSKSKLKAKKFKSLAGSATDATKVEIAILKPDKSLLKKKKRCLQLKNSKAALKKVKAVKGKCQPSVWLGASGTSSWSYKLKKTLRPGKYTIYLRASGPGGISATAKKNLTLTG